MAGAVGSGLQRQGTTESTTGYEQEQVAQRPMSLPTACTEGRLSSSPKTWMWGESRACGAGRSTAMRASNPLQVSCGARTGQNARLLPRAHSKVARERRTLAVPECMHNLPVMRVSSVVLARFSHPIRTCWMAERQAIPRWPFAVRTSCSNLADAMAKASDGRRQS